MLAVLLWQHNEYAAWCVVGAVLSSFLCKVSGTRQRSVPTNNTNLRCRPSLAGPCVEMAGFACCSQWLHHALVFES